MSVGNLHILSYCVCLLLLLIGGRLGLASGPATRDVHLFNNIIGVYQLSYHQVHWWRQIPSGHVHVHRASSTLPIPPMSSPDASGGSRTSSPLVAADISIHEGLFRVVRLLLYVQINSVFQVNFLLLILILWSITLSLLMIHLLALVSSGHLLFAGGGKSGWIIY